MDSAAAITATDELGVKCVIAKAMFAPDDWTDTGSAGLPCPTRTWAQIVAVTTYQCTPRRIPSERRDDGSKCRLRRPVVSDGVRCTPSRAILKLGTTPSDERERAR